MKHVSLLPPEIKAKRLAQRKLGRLYLLLVIVIIIIVFINLYYLVNIFFVRQNLKTLQNERTTIENQAVLLLEYENLNQQLIGTKNLINNAMGTVPHWGALLSDVSKALPVGSQLSELRLNYNDQSGTVTMRGWVSDHGALADLLERLYSVEQLDQTQCRISTETGAEGREVIQFHVESVILSGNVFITEGEGGE